MSRRDHYPPGVPCWVETLTADPDAAQRFYGGLFGWEFAGSGPLPGPGLAEYFVARRDGHDVAGVAPLPPPPAEPPPPAWNTHVSVADVDEAAARAVAAGGALLLEPLDALPAGRIAVVADTAGAVICLWEPASRPGAGLVNEPSAWAMSLLSTDDPRAPRPFTRSCSAGKRKPLTRAQARRYGYGASPATSAANRNSRFPVTSSRR